MEPLFSVQPTTLGEVTKFTCMVSIDHRDYVFRYAYDTQEQANSVMGNLRKSFGQPAGIDNDLVFNYWRFSPGILASWRYIRRTTQKTSFYIDRGV